MFLKTKEKRKKLVTPQVHIILYVLCYAQATGGGPRQHSGNAAGTKQQPEPAAPGPSNDPDYVCIQYD